MITCCLLTIGVPMRKYGEHILKVVLISIEFSRNVSILKSWEDAFILLEFLSFWKISKSKAKLLQYVHSKNNTPVGMLCL